MTCIYTDDTGRKWRKGFRIQDHVAIHLPNPFHPVLDHVGSVQGGVNYCVLKHKVSGNFYFRWAPVNSEISVLCRVFEVQS